MAQPAEDGFGLQRIGLSAAVSRGGLREGGERRIWNSRSQGHMRTAAIVVLVHALKRARKCDSYSGTSQLRHSLRNVPITRSQMAFIFGQ